MAMAQLAEGVSALLRCYETLILIWCIMSWLPMREGGLVYDVATVVDRLVRPFMGLFRRFIPPLGGIDFSPVVAILVLDVVGNFVVRILYGVV